MNHPPTRPGRSTILRWPAEPVTDAAKPRAPLAPVGGWPTGGWIEALVDNLQPPVTAWRAPLVARRLPESGVDRRSRTR